MNDFWRGFFLGISGLFLLGYFTKKMQHGKYNEFDLLFKEPLQSGDGMHGYWKKINLYAGSVMHKYF